MKNVFFVLLAVLLVVACQKEAVVDIKTETPIYNPPKTEISGSILGKVTDENGDNLEGVLVQYNGKMMMTDVNGEFLLENTQLFADGTYLEVGKKGYFNGSRKIYAIDNQINYLHVQLIEKVLHGSINGAEGGSIQIDQASIDLPVGQYIDLNGEAYAGEVNVYAKWLDPSKEETFLEMPGDLTGVDLNGDFKALATYGMMVVELEDQDGQEISLPQNNMATIHMPVPAEFLHTAPETIPLWHFDESNGTWVEEGQAQLINNTYVGEVGHFSFWNCDIPVDPIEISGKVLLNGNPSIGVKVKVYDETSYYAVNSFTNEEGIFVSQVPQDGNLKIIVYDACGTQLQTNNYGPFSMDSDIGTISIEAELGSFSISGQITACSPNILGTSFIVLDFDDTSYAYLVDENNSYKIELADCTISEASIYSIDIENKIKSETQELSLFGHTIQNLETCESTDRDSIFYRSVPAVVYDKMDWGYALGFNYLLEGYTLAESKESDGSITYIYTIEIIDWLSGILGMEGTFTFKKGDDEANYIIKFPQGFSAEGNCKIIDDPLGRILTDRSTNIIVTDPDIYPGNISEVYFATRID